MIYRVFTICIIQQFAICGWEYISGSTNINDPGLNDLPGARYGSATCYDSVANAMIMFGGYGYTKDFPVEKFYRDSKLCTIGEGTSEIQKIVIAREVLK